MHLIYDQVHTKVFKVAFFYSRHISKIFTSNMMSALFSSVVTVEEQRTRIVIIYLNSQPTMLFNQHCIILLLVFILKFAKLQGAYDLHSQLCQQDSIQQGI